MEPEIPEVVDELYLYFVSQPNPKFWPEYLKKDPVRGHGLWAFYQGLRLGLQIADVTVDKQ